MSDEEFDPYNEYCYPNQWNPKTERWDRGGWRCDPDERINGLKLKRSGWKPFDEMTPLRDIPRLWLQLIEPYIERDARYGACWVWHGPVRKANQRIYPIFKVNGLCDTSVVRFIANNIWDIDRTWFCYQSCGNLRCVNPYHIVVTWNNPGLDMAWSRAGPRAHPAYRRWKYRGEA